jgi:hypothetical protein
VIAARRWRKLANERVKVISPDRRFGAAAMPPASRLGLICF